MHLTWLPVGIYYKHQLLTLLAACALSQTQQDLTTIQMLDKDMPIYPYQLEYLLALNQRTCNEKHNPLR